jgi:DNA polymerase-3 subunit delta'
MSVLYGDVIGQERAVAALRAAADRPVHAYLLVGPPGTGRLAAARSFAAALLCPSRGEHPGGDAEHCEVCRRVLAETHPDVTVVEREGPAISIDMARQIIRLAARSPVEGDSKVLILLDFHLVKEAGPALLKTIEEPSPSTVFVILAEYVPPELVTIASRCARIDFAPLTPAQVADALRAGGVPPDRVDELAAAAGGRLDRARLLASDPEFVTRRQAWLSVPGRLDPSGAAMSALADELVTLLDSSVAPLRARQEEELAELERVNAVFSEVGGRGGGGRGGRPGLKELEERHRREIRRQRTDELRAGLATLAGVYRDRLVGGGPAAVTALEAIGVIHDLNANLAYNPNETIQLPALLVRLSRL